MLRVALTGAASLPCGQGKFLFGHPITKLRITDAAFPMYTDMVLGRSIARRTSLVGGGMADLRTVLEPRKTDRAQAVDGHIVASGQ